MENGTCYVYDSTTTIFAFPYLSCTDGDSLPSFIQTTRDTFYIDRGRLIKVSSSLVNSSSFDYSNYVAHVYNGESFLNYNYLLLPCTLFVICFLTIIYRWFIRLRG